MCFVIRLNLVNLWEYRALDLNMKIVMKGDKNDIAWKEPGERAQSNLAVFLMFIHWDYSENFIKISQEPKKFVSNGSLSP